MDIKLQGEDAFGYSGSIEIGTIKDGVKTPRYVHNAGHIALFKYLAGCLAGTVNPNYNIDNRPGRLGLFNDSDRVLSYNLQYNDYAIVENESDSDPSCTITFNFIIPGTVILNRDITDVKLYPLGSNDEYASANIGQTMKVSDINTNLYVSWTLRIRNS